MQLFNRSSKTNGARSRTHTPSAIQFLLAQPKARTHGHGGGSVIAFTSANAGAGVSHVCRKLAAQLAAQTHEPTAIVEAERLTTLQPNDLIDLRGKCARTTVDQLWMLRKSANGNGHQAATPSVSEMAEGFDCVQKLRSTFSHTLLDCPPISESHETPLLASHVDGVVLVVEADQTKRDQILRARQAIEMAGGSLLGMVLNKRRHHVPDWLYRML
jgi:Mrp family chromosome partitioning ATPase